MSDATIEHVFSGMPVSDYRAAIEWYSAVFGRAPDVVVREEHESMWQLAVASWIYVVHDPDRAGRSLVTILVDDLERHASAMRSRGVDVSRRETLAGVYMKAILTDVDGNMVTFAETLEDPEEHPPR